MTNPNDLTYDPALHQALSLPVVFYNPGHLDPRSFQVFGLSAKPGSTNPIGQFGTGLKYAIAVCLRHGCDIEIELTRDFLHGQPSGTSRKFSFGVRHSEFRGQSTTEIFYQESGPDWKNEPRILPFTLDLGKHWELWQAFRELESNVRDEGGESGLNLTPPDPNAEATIIRVTGHSFAEVYAKRYEYFLHPCYYTTAKHTADACYTLAETKSVYLKGVRVYEASNDLLFTYDFKTSLPLTEDRTIMSIWSLRAALTRHWLGCTNRDEIYNAITAPKAYEEHNLEFDDSPFAPTEAFKEAVHKALEHRPMSLNPTARKKAQVDTFDERFVKPLELTATDEKRLIRAKDFLLRLGYNMDDYGIRLVDVDAEIAGMAKENTIFLTRIAFRQSTLYLASTLLEEYFHLKHGYTDHTAAFQDFLHDEILRMGEKLFGDPL